MPPKPGDSVLFHFTPMHVCGGGKALSADVMVHREKIGLSAEPEDGDCRCAQDATGIREATVIAVLDPDPGDDRIALELEVVMTADDLALGYATRQSCSFEATGSPPESGSWTEVESKKHASDLARASRA